MSHFDYLQASYADADRREIHRLRAEVETLRAQVSEERDLRLAAQTRADAAEDQGEDAAKVIAAVREVCKTYHLDDSYPNRRKVVFLDRILRALGGGA